MAKLFPLSHGYVLCSVLATLTYGLSTPSAYADVKDGVDAWSDGHFEAAVAQWQPYADKGDPDAQFNLGQAYKLGRGVPLNAAKAEELYGKAAAKGHLQAADAYGLMLFQRGEHARALPYIEAAAARGEPRGQYILGIAHFNGDIVAKDWVRAYALLTLAHQAGLSQAPSALAQMDQYIPLADRQKAIALSARLATQVQANQQRLNTAAELDTQLALGSKPVSTSSAVDTRADTAEDAGADYVSAYSAPPRPVAGIAQATKPQVPTPTPPLKRTPDSPASSGADYAQAKPVSAVTARVATAAPATPATVKPQAKPQAAPPTPARSTAEKPTPAPSGPWRIQLGAFGVAGNADALWNRIKNKPELAGRSKALVKTGTLTRLHATGFTTREQAETACQSLNRAGQSCMVLRN